MSSATTIIQDDGEFYLDLNINENPATASGFLHRRCPVSPTTPGGYEVVGAFTAMADGRWRAGVFKACLPDSDEDMLVLGEFDRRMDALLAVWQRRREAYCRH